MIQLDGEGVYLYAEAGTDEPGDEQDGQRRFVADEPTGEFSSQPIHVDIADKVDGQLDYILDLQAGGEQVPTDVVKRDHQLFDRVVRHMSTRSDPELAGEHQPARRANLGLVVETGDRRVHPLRRGIVKSRHDESAWSRPGEVGHRLLSERFREVTEEGENLIDFRSCCPVINACGDAQVAVA